MSRIQVLVCSVFVGAYLSSGCVVRDEARGDAVASLESFRAAYLDAVCGWGVRCCNAVDIDRAFGIEVSEATTCEDVFAPDIDALLARTLPGVRAGSIAFSTTQADACLAHLRTLACGADPERLLRSGPCADVLVGLRFPGESCANDYDCNDTGGINYCSEGECKVAFRAFGPLGSTCNRDDLCTPGLLCFNGRCREGARVGAHCGPDLVPCEGDDCEDGLCPPGRWDGDSCSRGSQCASGFCSRAGRCESARCVGVEGL